GHRDRGALHVRAAQRDVRAREDGELRRDCDRQDAHRDEELDEAEAAFVAAEAANGHPHGAPSERYELVSSCRHDPGRTFQVVVVTDDAAPGVPGGTVVTVANLPFPLSVAVSAIAGPVTTAPPVALNAPLT